MQALFDFLQRYGYWILFANVLVEQIGLPIPALPLLLAMGALSGMGDFSLALSVLLAVLAALTSDLIWYRLGLRRGGRILGVVCRLSLEPDSCVSNTKPPSPNGAPILSSSRSLCLASTRWLRPWPV